MWIPGKPPVPRDMRYILYRLYYSVLYIRYILCKSLYLQVKIESKRLRFA